MIGSAWARPLQEAGPIACTISASGKARVTSPAPQRRLRSSERHRCGEADRVDCVRIVHWMRNALARVQPKQRPAVVALLKTIFAQDTAEAAREQWAAVADALRERFPTLAELMDGSREDVLVYMSFPREHWAQIASTNPLERLNREIKRRSDVVGIFPNDPAVIRLVGALMLEQNDEWAVSRRYMSLESLASLSDDPVLRLSAVAA